MINVNVGFARAVSLSHVHAFLGLGLLPPYTKSQICENITGDDFIYLLTLVFHYEYTDSNRTLI